MASLLSILKNVINLNRVHVEKSEIVTVPERHFGEIYEEKRIYIWLRPIRRYQSRCPICGKKCHGYDYRSEEESWWRASNLNGIPVYLFYALGHKPENRTENQNERIALIAIMRSHFRKVYSREIRMR